MTMAIDPAKQALLDSYTKPTLVALAGDTGVGKDTLASKLVKDYGYIRLAFGDELRRMVIDEFGLPGDFSSHESQQEAERQPGYSTWGSFKDTMVYVGGQLAIRHPALLTNKVQAELSTYAQQYKMQSAVVTDMRKPIEMMGLAALSSMYNVYYVYVKRTVNPHPPKPLDGLLTDKSHSIYNSERILMQPLPQFNGVIKNDGEPETMLSQLKRILELSLPYGPNQVLASDLYEWNGYH